MRTKLRTALSLTILSAIGVASTAHAVCTHWSDFSRTASTAGSAKATLKPEGLQSKITLGPSNPPTEFNVETLSKSSTAYQAYWEVDWLKSSGTIRRDQGYTYPSKSPSHIPGPHRAQSGEHILEARVSVGNQCPGF